MLFKFTIKNCVSAISVAQTWRCPTLHRILRPQRLRGWVGVISLLTLTSVLQAEATAANLNLVDRPLLLANLPPYEIALSEAETAQTTAPLPPTELEPSSATDDAEIAAPDTYDQISEDAHQPQTNPISAIWLWLLLPLLLMLLVLRWVARQFLGGAANHATTHNPELEQTHLPTPPDGSHPLTVADNSLGIPQSTPAPEAEPLAQRPRSIPEVDSETAQPVDVAAIHSAVDMSDPKSGFLTALGQQIRPETATLREHYLAFATLVRDHLLQLNTPETDLPQTHSRIVGEIATEYHLDFQLRNSLLNLDYYTEACQILQQSGLNPEDMFEQDREFALASGNLGVLMTSYLDSLSTLAIPAIGYGIRYAINHAQGIQNGWQTEIANERYDSPWEMQRPAYGVEVGFGGQVQTDPDGQEHIRWIPAEVVYGQCYDTPIVGHRTRTVSLLRLWSASDSHINKVLSPANEFQGELRLKQQFFLMSCALQNVVRLHTQAGHAIEMLPDRFALQLNDTDTALAVTELMRLLLDEQELGWEMAWEIASHTLTYTNHSVIPETLDRQWSIEMFGRLLPRHLEIVYEINARFLAEVRSTYPGDEGRVRRMSLIDDAQQSVRLIQLASLSHAINGVSRLHSMILRGIVLPDFYDMYPQKFKNQTNGISPRRWLQNINPSLADLISSTIGTQWLSNLEHLRHLEPYAEDPTFRQQWRTVKQTAKQTLATYIAQQTGTPVDPASLFTVQVASIHEHNRQHLRLLQILALYSRIKANPAIEIQPHTLIFAGKAAPDYALAQLIIKLIHAVASLVNHDSDVAGLLKVVFLPDFPNQGTRYIYPAIDLVECLSLPGTAAGDITTLIACMNGAVMLGSPDGLNLEIEQAVGSEQCFRFGLDLQEGLNLKLKGYNSWSYYNANPDLKTALDWLTTEALTGGDLNLFQPLFHQLMEHDQYLLLADFQAYLDCQEQVSLAFQDSDQWTRLSILNTARMGYFSSDRAIRDYGHAIWNIPLKESKQ